VSALLRSCNTSTSRTRDPRAYARCEDLVQKVVTTLSIGVEYLPVRGHKGLPLG